jgi:RND family efflux transporter MFP subunit
VVCQPAFAQPEELAVVRVAAISLEPRPYSVTLPDKVGVLEAAASQSLGFEVAGRVERILGQGARVEAGGEIAALESALEEAEVRRASLLVQDARSELERVLGLRKSRAASEAALESARTAVGMRLAERDAAVERLARRHLEARFAGVVADVQIDPGEIATPGHVIAELLNFELMKLEVGVAGYQIGSVKPGAEVIVTVPALAGQEFAGHVLGVAPSAGNGHALFEVEILVPNDRAVLKPGMSARTRIVTRSIESALVVPLEAVVQRADQRVVFFIEQGRARAVALDDATLHGDRLILPGSLPYRELVVRGQHDLQEGFAVEVDNAVIAGLAEGWIGLEAGVSTR